MDLVFRPFNLLVNSVLLLTVPVTLLYSQGNQSEVPARVQKVNLENQQPERSHVPSYDEIMHLLDDLESGELEKRCNANDLDKINQYLAFLAQEGVLPDDSEESLSLEDDIEELLNGEENSYQYAVYHGGPGDFMIASAFVYQDGDVVLCKSWVQKQWKNTKKFCKKHKKSLIIGAAVVVAAAAIIVAVVAAPAAAGAAAASAGGAAAASGAGSDKSDEKEKEEPSAVPSEVLPRIAAAEESPTLKSAIDHEITSFKANIVQEKFFNPLEFSERPQALSWEEDGRTLGSLFAHDSLNNLQDQIASNPKFAQEIQEMEFKADRFMPEWNNSSKGHPEIDRKFSTDYTYLFANPGQDADLTTLSYQIRGERALEYGYLTQAVQDLGKAIELSPESPIPYLERGVAHFGLGQYDRSLEDYREFTSQSKKIYPLEVTYFSIGFAKGLPKGIYDSSEGIFLLVSDLVRHPINTGEQVFNALSHLADLAVSNEWLSIREALAPEVHQLIEEWNTIPSNKRGELAGYALGKHRSDIVIPGALTKVVARGVNGAKDLVQVCKALQTAEKTLLLESVAGLESGAKIGEVVRASQTTIGLGEELGYSAHEMTQLKQVGKLEGAVNSGLDRLVSQSESEVLKTAISQNKHVKMVVDYLDKPTKEIQKGVNSYEKQIAIHKDKIVNPTKYYPDWDKLDPRQREALINKKWPVEISGYEEQRNLLQSIINERVSYE